MGLGGGFKCKNESTESRLDVMSLSLSVPMYDWTVWWKGLIELWFRVKSELVSESIGFGVGYDCAEIV